MRALLGKDLAPFTKVLAKMELRDLTKTIFKEWTKKKEGKEQRDLGVLASDLVWGIVENYHKAETEVFEFLAGLEGKTGADIGNLPLPEFIGLISELFSEKNLPFFKSAANLTQRN